MKDFVPTSGNAGHPLAASHPVLPCTTKQKVSVAVKKSGRGVHTVIKSVKWSDGRIFKPLRTRHAGIVTINGLKATMFEITFASDTVRSVYRDLNGWFVLV